MEAQLPQHHPRNPIDTMNPNFDTYVNGGLAQFEAANALATAKSAEAALKPEDMGPITRITAADKWAGWTDFRDNPVSDRLANKDEVVGFKGEFSEAELSVVSLQRIALEAQAKAAIAAEGARSLMKAGGDVRKLDIMGPKKDLLNDSEEDETPRQDDRRVLQTQ